MTPSRALPAVFAAMAWLAASTPAAAESAGVKVGVLTCNVASGWGLVFGSSRDLNCSFAPNPVMIETYEGKIDKFGVDIGYQKHGVMVWAVFAPTEHLAPGSLAGEYAGISAGAAAGVGGSANALVGGSNKTISLSPLSVEGAPGLNIAAGVAAIKLTYKP
jgi:hypothetical protein